VVEERLRHIIGGGIFGGGLFRNGENKRGLRGHHNKRFQKKLLKGYVRK